MIKTAAPHSTAARSKNEADTPKKDKSPGSQFIGASLSMGWQLAIVVLIPVVGGYKIDQHLKTAPLWTIVGFVLAMIGTFLVIKKVYDEFNSKIYDEDSKK